MSGHTATNTEAAKGDLVHFTFKKPLYDLNTYVGRFKSVWSQTNPIVFWATKSQIKKAQELMNNFQEKENILQSKGERLMLTKDEINSIYKADGMIRSAVHPDTGSVIPIYMRLSAYMYANIPINFGMLLTAPTNFNIALWQWINQTYYVGVNYSNRNASSKFTNADLVKAYFCACAASIVVGLGVKKIIEPFKNSFSGSKAFFFMFTISYIANATANASNLMIIRSKEFREGIPVTDSEGNAVGVSKKVGRSAVTQTAVTRMILPILPLGVPVIAFFCLDKMHMIPKSKPLKVIQQTFIFALSTMFSPAAA